MAIKQFKMTTAGKLIILAFFIAVVAGITYWTGGFDVLKPGKIKIGDNGTQAPIMSTDRANNEIRLSLDEWIGWNSIVAANGGLETKKGSIYDKLGIKVKISVINDANQSSVALINNNLDAAGYTINRYAFLYPKFIENKAPVKMVYINNYSNGGDGIIVKENIKSINDLVGKKIGVPRFSEAQTLVEWFLSKSTLTDDQIREIRKNMVMFDTPDDAAKAFFAGQLDACATWQPYLTQATETTGCKVLFSTKNATNIILDGIIFKDDFVAKNPELVKNFVKGSLQATSLYSTEVTAIKSSFPLFENETVDTVKAMTSDASILDCQGNVKAMNGVAQSLFVDMSNIWKALGEKADVGAASKAFNNAIITSLTSEFPTAATPAPATKFTPEQREKAKGQDNTQALLQQKLTINFKPNLAVITEDSYESLNKFAETATILNGAIIQVEGNVSADGNPSTDISLSTSRAKSVAQYLQSQGLDPTRFVIIGNGVSKPIGDNSTPDGRKANMRTDIFFKIVEVE